MTENNTVEIPVIYEDDDILVINKPAGVVVNRSHTYQGITVQDWVEQRIGERGVKDEYQPIEKSDDEQIIFGDPLEIFRQRSGIVHRLDRETSGVMMIAKHPSALIAYMTQFKKREVTKTYLALVHGKVHPNEGSIDLPIGRNTGNRLQFAVREGGKESRTDYHVVHFYPHLNVEKVLEKRKHSFVSMTDGEQGVSRNFKRASKIYQGFTLVEVTPKTGRTHQIRVHFAHMKHPLVGDKVYSGNKRRLIDQHWCPRHFLHASGLTCTHIRTKNELKLTAPLPEDLEKALEVLE